MRVVRADGHQQQQWALSNIYTQKIARVLSDHIDEEALVRGITRILKMFNGEIYTDLDKKLADFRAVYEIYYQAKRMLVPAYVVEVIQAVHELYYQPLYHRLYHQQKEQIDSLRGAVVERLGLELIRHRYQGDDECANSRRFIDQGNRPVTLQEVDIAAISHRHRQLEGYECKIKAHYFADHDRSDLEYLYNTAGEEGYQAQVGVISLDLHKYIERRLRELGASSCIQAFGVDTLVELQYSPFE